MKTYLIYGLAMAIAGAVVVVVLYLLGLHSDPARLGTAQALGMVLGILIGVTCITLGTKARRATLPPHEEFGYGRALGAGVMITLFAALFGMVTSYCYARFINPDFTEVVVQAEVQKLEARNANPSQVEAAERMIRLMTRPGLQAVFGAIGGLVMGTLISLVTAAFLKRRATEAELSAPPPIST